MTVPRMLLIALAIMIPVVFTSLVLADVIAPVVDSRSFAARSVALAGYTIAGALAGYVFARQDRAHTDRRRRTGVVAAPDPHSFRKRLLVSVGILLVPLFLVNLVTAPDRWEFLRWEMHVFGSMAAGGVLSYLIGRLRPRRTGG
jgi:hypothetical protein